MQCETCGGECWDNRQKVAGGWKGPLFKCKDRNCGWVKWPPKPKPGQVAPAANGHGPKWTWGQLAKTYERCILVAEPRVVDLGQRTKLPVTIADVLAAAATMFITASRDGIQEPKVSLPPAQTVPEPSDDEPY
jgi:hypothetical protein